MPDDPEPLCVHCGLQISTIEHTDGTVLGYRHDLRIEPWDHDLEVGFGVPVPPPRACDLCGADSAPWTYPMGPAPREERGDAPPIVETRDLGDDEYELTVNFEPDPDLTETESQSLLLELLFHAWHTCDPCSVMIADDNADGLLSRALATRPTTDEATLTRLRATLRTFLSFKTHHPEPATD